MPSPPPSILRQWVQESLEHQGFTAIFSAGLATQQLLSLILLGLPWAI